jgi:hypothetical protein
VGACVRGGGGATSKELGGRCFGGSMMAATCRFCFWHSRTTRSCRTEESGGGGKGAKGQVQYNNHFERNAFAACVDMCQAFCLCSHMHLYLTAPSHLALLELVPHSFELLTL